MNRSVLAALVTLVLAVRALGQDQSMAASYRSDHLGVRYDFAITHAQILAEPDWPEGTDDPPLAPRKALALASASLAAFLPDAAQWPHPKITLQSIVAPQKWVYVIEFTGPLPPNALDGMVDRMSVPVLMDRTVISPRLSRSDLVSAPVRKER